MDNMQNHESCAHASGAGAATGAGSASAAQGLYNALFMDHVNHPDWCLEMTDASISHTGVNPSCGDELVFYLKINDQGIIEEASYQGHGCAISQASADMMSDCIIDKSADEARALCGLFGRMIRAELTSEDDIQDLSDASLLKDISHMPARVKCAELAWNTLQEMLTPKTKA